MAEYQQTYGGEGRIPMDSLNLTSSFTIPEKTPITPKWLEMSIAKKRSITPLYLPIDDLVSKCLGMSSKTKKLKNESMLEFDKDIGHWLEEIANLFQDKDDGEMTTQDYQVSKVDLGRGSRAVYRKIFEVSNKKIIE